MWATNIYCSTSVTFSHSSRFHRFPLIFFAPRRPPECGVTRATHKSEISSRVSIIEQAASELSSFQSGIINFILVGCVQKPIPGFLFVFPFCWPGLLSSATSLDAVCSRAMPFRCSKLGQRRVESVSETKSGVNTRLFMGMGGVVGKQWAEQIPNTQLLNGMLQIPNTASITSSVPHETETDFECTSTLLDK